MAAPLGNEYNKKFTEKEERQELCRLWCEHLKAGLSKSAFVPCDKKTVKRVAEEHPEDFPPEKLKEAERQYAAFWEQAGVNGMMGNIEGFNATTWIFNMKNRFNWRDKREDKVDVNARVNISVIDCYQGEEG